MARYTFNKGNWTPVVVADATNFTDSGYMAVQGGNGTQRIDIYDIFLGGAATSSAAMQLAISRDVVVGVTALTGVLVALTDPTATAPGTLPIGFSASTTKPQRSSTLQLMQCPFNAFGGTFRWTAPDMAGAFGILGNVTTLGEISVSHLNAGTPGLVGATFLGDIK